MAEWFGLLGKGEVGRCLIGTVPYYTDTFLDTLIPASISQNWSAELMKENSAVLSQNYDAVLKERQVAAIFKGRF